MKKDIYGAGGGVGGMGTYADMIRRGFRRGRGGVWELPNGGRAGNSRRR